MKTFASRFSISIIILIFSSLSVSAATLTVSNTNNGGAGSLRQAISNATSGDTIVFSATGTITLTTQITINKDLTIIGPGATSLAIDGNNNSWIFSISSGNTVAISGMTFQNGDASLSGLGGAIYNDGILTINNSNFSGNSADDGGAIWSEDDSTLTINNSTFSGNSSSGNGGAIYSDFDSILTINNSTFSDNSANYGGALQTTGSIVEINNSTFSDNSATASGGAIYLFGSASVTINNSIISGNTAIVSGDDCENGGGTITANSNNIFGTGGNDGGCTAGTSDIVPTGAIGTILSGLANNGGPTQTHALVAGSPAIDASGSGALATDQRGVPAQSTRDSGAFEFGASLTYPIVQFTAASATYSETDGTVNIGLTISPAVDFADIAEVYVVDAFTGSATSGDDYTAFVPQIITIDCSSGTCPASDNVSLTISTDSIIENDEIANLKIAGTNGFATIGSPSTYVATIQDTTTSTATITANDADATEDPVDNGQFTVDLGGVNDTDSAITVNYSISGTATNGTDYTAVSGTVDVADGQQTATIDIIPIADVIVEGSETVEQTLTSTDNADVSVDTTPATVTITDSTTIATITANDADATEDPVDNGQFTIDLGRVNDTGSVITINYSISGTATNGTDYTAISGTVDVANGQQTATIDVTPIDDVSVEADETVELTLISISRASIGVDTTPAIVTIISEDRRPDDEIIDSTDGDSTQSSNNNSNALWSISISASPPFVQGGETVIFTIEILKLSGGTPVTMEFPLSNQFTIQSVTSNRGSASFSGQTVIFSDDIHVGDTPVITVTTLLDATLSSPETLQSCIVSPTNLCASITLAQILELPTTGETPNWRTPILLMLVLSGVLAVGGVGAVFFRRSREI
jgi:predicted outer membrane repeat protein